jgi:hypothetical protein
MSVTICSLSVKWSSSVYSIVIYFGVSAWVAANGCVYETFGISKRFPIKLQLLLIRAEMLDKPLTAKCFIHVVSRSVFIFSVIFLSICYFVSFYCALGQTHSLTSFGFSFGSCGLAMCVAVERWLFHTCHFAG